MDDDLLLSMSVLVLALAVLALAKRVASLEEDADLAAVKADGAGTLLDAKKAIVKRAADRAEARGRRS